MFNYNTRTTRLIRHQEVEEDFVQKIISMKLKDLASHAKGPVEDGIVPIEVRYPASAAHLKSFLPLLMEDAKSVISTGLDKSTKRIFTPFNLDLLSVRRPKTSGNPWIMNFRGTIKTKDDESGYTMNVLLLSRGKFKFIAVASDFDHIRAKCRISGQYFDSSPVDFAPGAKWSATYLGSLVTHERIFDTCSNLTETPLLRNIARGVAPSFTLPSVPFNAYAGLNTSQTAAVTMFHRLKPDNLMTLEGPPGTGKTTTVTVLLQDLYIANKRTLVCAPSNKAVQVLASRFFEDHPNAAIVFTGVESKVQDSLRPIYLNGLVDNISRLIDIINDKISTVEAQETCGFRAVWMETHTLFVHSLFEAMFRRYCVSGSVVDIPSVAQLVIKYNRIMSSYDADKKAAVQLMRSYFQTIKPMLKHFKSPSEDLTDRDHLGQLILNQCRIVFSTLSSSGGSMMLGMDDVDVLIVDEAGQSIEAETLIALQHNPRKVLLVGDTKQLPATVIYQHAEATHYDWSMMLRLTEKCGAPCSNMLTIQYRMHPDICRFPSKQYYNGALLTADAVHNRVAPLSAHLPYAIYDVGSGKEEVFGNSKRNPVEANFVVEVIKHIRSTDRVSSIGVITPYSAHRELINQKLKGKAFATAVKVSTVDGFQGDECDIIIVSFVRANKKNMIGFVNDARRLNVAITRPKHTLVVLCSASALEHGSAQTKALILDARHRGLLHTEGQLGVRLGLVAPSSEAGGKTGGGKKTKKLNKAVAAHQNAYAAAVASTATTTAPGNNKTDKKGKGGTKPTTIHTVEELSQSLASMGVSSQGVTTSTRAATAPVTVKPHIRPRHTAAAAVVGDIGDAEKPKKKKFHHFKRSKSGV